MILRKFISENPLEIIIIDVIDKMQMKDQEGLLTMMERAAFTSTKIRNTKTVKANVVIFAKSNSTERLTKPLLSRFTVYGIPEYSYPEFDNTDSFGSVEIGKQRYKRCLEDCQIM